MSAQASPGELAGRRRVGVRPLLGVTIGVLLMLACVGIGLALNAESELRSNRRLLLRHVDPARRDALRLETALVDEETGVRGYALTGANEFLQPYSKGLQSEALAYSQLRRAGASVGGSLGAGVAAVQAAVGKWRRTYVAKALVRHHSSPRARLQEDVTGKRLFDAIRGTLARLQSNLATRGNAVQASLEHTANTLDDLLIVAGILIVGGVIAAGLLLDRTIIRPLALLGSEARQVAGGRFAQPMHAGWAPREISEVAADIEAMRERIVQELATVERARGQLEHQARDLARSNSELEQFAYVASHDLQEPLRKVASFCQALKSRYEGQLDDRADQYIDFAVDGAKRMQVLINDLLAFSRVGRSGRQDEPVALAGVLEEARSELATAIEDTGAQIRCEDPLPTVRGDRTLVVSLFSNLISNAIKFRGDRALEISISCSRGQSGWELAFADNGIGIEAEYAERIFLIFQRLHSREDYEGSGIGLALCRKIVEYHGGRIWLDRGHSPGACFRFTLPSIEERTS